MKRFLRVEPRACIAKFGSPKTTADGGGAVRGGMHVCGGTPTLIYISDLVGESSDEVRRQADLAGHGLSDLNTLSYSFRSLSCVSEDRNLGSTKRTRTSVK
jgi:hypothetical protein